MGKGKGEGNGHIGLGNVNWGCAGGTGSCGEFPLVSGLQLVDHNWALDIELECGCIRGLGKGNRGWEVWTEGPKVTIEWCQNVVCLAGGGVVTCIDVSTGAGVVDGLWGKEGGAWCGENDDIGACDPVPTATTTIICGELVQTVTGKD